MVVILVIIRILSCEAGRLNSNSKIHFHMQSRSLKVRERNASVLHRAQRKAPSLISWPLPQAHPGGTCPGTSSSTASARTLSLPMLVSGVLAVHSQLSFSLGTILLKEHPKLCPSLEAVCPTQLINMGFQRSAPSLRSPEASCFASLTNFSLCPHTASSLSILESEIILKNHFYNSQFSEPQSFPLETNHDRCVMTSL